MGKMSGEPGTLVVRYAVESLPSSYFLLSPATTTLITVDERLFMSFSGGTVAQELMPEKSQICGFPQTRPSYHSSRSRIESLEQKYGGFRPYIDSGVYLFGPVLLDRLVY